MGPTREESIRHPSKLNTGNDHADGNGLEAGETSTSIDGRQRQFDTNSFNTDRHTSFPSGNHGLADHSAFGNSFNILGYRFSSGGDESKSLLEKSRRATDRLKQKKRRLQSSTAPASFGSQGSVASQSFRQHHQAPKEESQVRKKKKEFVRSNRGMLIPRHWGNELQRMKNRNKAPPKEISKGSRSHKKNATSSSLQSPSDWKSTPPSAKSSAKSRGSAPFTNSGLHNSRAISFAPEFMRKAPLLDDPVVEDSDSRDVFSDTETDPAASSVAPPTGWWSSPLNPPKKQRKTSSNIANNHGATNNNGKWSMRYKKVHDGFRADALRLRNSAGASSTSSTDPMDPRNTASSRSVISVVSESTTHWTPESSDGFTCLVHLHEHKILINRHTGNTDADDCGPRGLAWCYFSDQAARERPFPAGAQMILYNAVVFDASDSTLPNIRLKIICTHLSEDYPKSFQKLPALNELVDQEGWNLGSPSH